MHIRMYIHVYTYIDVHFSVVLFYMYFLRLKGQGGVDKNEVRLIAGPVMDTLTKRFVLEYAISATCFGCYHQIVMHGCMDVQCCACTYMYTCLYLTCHC